MWGQIAQAVSGAIQAKSKVYDLKPMQVGDYGHAASASNKEVENKPENTAIQETKPEITQTEENKEQDKDSSTPLNALSDEQSKDTTNPVGKSSWDENKKKISDVLNVVGQFGDTMKKFQKKDDSTNIKPVSAINYGSPAVSDGTLKNKEKIERLFQGDNAIDAFSKIDAYVYKYNQKAQENYAGEKGVDDETHFGPIAQDLAKNPVTSGTVHRDESGYLTVDTRQLALTNTAMISQLARKIEELEEKLGGR